MEEVSVVEVLLMALQILQLKESGSGNEIFKYMIMEHRIKLYQGTFE